jgi:F0F1-type ATP synthase membrane subunit b/b'
MILSDLSSVFENRCIKAATRINIIGPTALAGLIFYCSIWSRVQSFGWYVKALLSVAFYIFIWLLVVCAWSLIGGGITKIAVDRRLRKTRAGLLPIAYRNSDAAELQRDLKQLLSRAKTLPERIDLQACDEVRREIDRLLGRAAEVESSSASETTAILLELRECLIDSWQKALANEEGAQRALEDG